MQKKKKIILHIPTRETREEEKEIEKLVKERNPDDPSTEWVPYEEGMILDALNKNKGAGEK